MGLMRTLYEAWQAYQQELNDPSLPPVQRDEMRDAFVAGAAALFDLVAHAASSEDCEAHLQALEHELNHAHRHVRPSSRSS